MYQIQRELINKKKLVKIINCTCEANTVYTWGDIFAKAT